MNKWLYWQGRVCVRLCPCLNVGGPSEELLCSFRFMGFLKVVSAILGRNINDHIHLIFPYDLLAARPISRLSKNHVYQPLQTKLNSIPTNHRQGVAVVGFCAAFMIVFTGCMKHGREGRAGCLFGISLQTPTEVTSPNIADTTFKSVSSLPVRPSRWHQGAGGRLLGLDSGVSVYMLTVRLYCKLSVNCFQTSSG